MNNNPSEFLAKITILRQLLDQYQVDALLLRRVSSFAWATCGATSYVNTAISEGAAYLMITRDRLYLATNNIEAPRLEQEEKLTAQGWEFRISPWDTPLKELHRLTGGLTLAADVPFPNAKDIGVEIARRRARLTSEEGERFRELGRLCAESMEAAAQKVRPGLSEYHLAALIGEETQQRGVQPIVNLVATDERAYHYRHPLPTSKKLERYAMLVLSGRKWGLVCSITRSLHFGQLPDELRRRVDAAAEVNSTLVAHSHPSNSLGNVLAAGQETYARTGFPDEWKHHHQGGVVGYEPREMLAVPGSEEMIHLGQALSWNPSISGAKIEDTILVGEQSNEILTVTSLWPVTSIPVPGTPFEVSCSDVLEIE